MKQIKITEVDNGFVIETLKQDGSVFKERYDRPTVVISKNLDSIKLTETWELIKDLFRANEVK